MKIAVFGKPGGGKSTLSLKIADLVELPLYQLDLIQFASGGVSVPAEIWARRHAEILAQPEWVLDGFGTPQRMQAMLQAADVLVYVERSPVRHYWWVTKRLFASPFTKPVGWPRGSPMLSSTLSSYRNLRLSPAFWTPAFKSKLLAMRPGKRVYIIRTRADESALLRGLRPGDR